MEQKLKLKADISKDLIDVNELVKHILLCANECDVLGNVYRKNLNEAVRELRTIIDVARDNVLDDSKQRKCGECIG